MKQPRTKKTNQRSVGKSDAEMGKKIRLLRVEQHWSQTKLGDKLSVSFQQIQKYEKGSNRVSAARLQQIAKLLGVEMAFFYGGDDQSREVERLMFVDSAFSVRLLRAYSRIRDQDLQKEMVSLMEILAKANQ